MTELKICGIKIRIEFSFLIFSAMLFLVRSSAEIYKFFIVCLFHEVGHTVTLRLCGGRIAVLDFCGAGIRIFPDRKRLLPVKHEIMILAAGPAANIAAFIISYLISGISDFALLNAGAAIFNLLPYTMLDGGSIIKLAAVSTPYETAVNNIMTFLRSLIIILMFFGTIMIDRRLMIFMCIAVFYFVYELR